MDNDDTSAVAARMRARMYPAKAKRRVKRRVKVDSLTKKEYESKEKEGLNLGEVVQQLALLNHQMKEVLDVLRRQDGRISGIEQQIKELRGEKTKGRAFAVPKNANAIVKNLSVEVNNNRNFYLSQSRHVLGETTVFEIGYTVASDVAGTWKTAFARAVKIINETCPGIDMVEAGYAKGNKRIHVQKGDDGAYTLGNVIQWDVARIKLSDSWSTAARNGTALHELLHALAAQHEHKRSDGASFGFTVNDEKGRSVKKDWDSKWKAQYEASHDVVGLTIFDPHSIMNYANCDGIFTVDTTVSENDRVNHITFAYSSRSPATGSKRRDVLSPLDAIGLNILYPPCKRDFYNPRNDGGKTGLYYCGRRGATKGHNYPASDTTDGRCGPNNGANCPACRVLKSSKMPIKNRGGYKVWQGSSGMIYCGRYFRKVTKYHDGYCGPNNGHSCDSCRALADL